METVLFVIHLLLAIALVMVILMQRSAQDGGGLTGGGSTMGGLFTARGSANLLTRTTAVLATLFICTSLLLAYIASSQHKARNLTDTIAPITAPATAPASTAPAPDANKAATPVAPAAPVAPQVPVSK